jgi:hypothetical protein
MMVVSVSLGRPGRFEAQPGFSRLVAVTDFQASNLPGNVVLTTPYDGITLRKR